jgi:hypothetical protein
LGHKSQRDDSEANQDKNMRTKKREEEKRRKLYENRLESCDIEVSGAISKLKKI